MEAVILSGGKGTRLKEFSKSLPKCLVEINGKAVIEHQFDRLKENGIRGVKLLLGHQSTSVVNFLKSNDFFNLDIEIIVEPSALGTGGALSQIKSISDDFLILSGDIIFDIDIKKLYDYHISQKSLITLVSHPNDHPFDSDIIEIDGNEKVTNVIKKGTNVKFYNNLVNSGIYVANREFLRNIESKKSDIVNDIIVKHIRKKSAVFSYNTSEYIKDMGTPERISQVSTDVKSGLVKSRNLKNKQVAVFLDRDGVINEEVNDLTHYSMFKFIPGSTESLNLLNKSKFLSIVVTNQPAVAKGFCELSDVHDTHKYMETELGKLNTKVDNIYFCPCHPEKGFAGENKLYKRECSFRKPDIGMFKEAEKKYNLDLAKSYIVGDRTVDIKAGSDAGTQTILVRTGYSGNDKKYNVKSDYICDDLLSAVKQVILK
tara:strand:- start:33424 stop:34710 length:1287 start_codon:yes stop_codon:yes gene_type:complete